MDKFIAFKLTNIEDERKNIIKIDLSDIPIKYILPLPDTQDIEYGYSKNKFEEYIENGVTFKFGGLFTNSLSYKENDNWNIDDSFTITIKEESNLSTNIFTFNSYTESLNIIFFAYSKNMVNFEFNLYSDEYCKLIKFKNKLITNSKIGNLIKLVNIIIDIVNNIDGSIKRITDEKELKKLFMESKII